MTEPPELAPSALPSLRSLTIVDASSGIAGPYAAAVLAGLGCRVVRVASNGADDKRDPSIKRLVESGKVPLHVDLNAAWGREAVDLALGSADGVIVSDGTLGRPEDLVQQHSRLVVVSVTPFGLTGPDRDLPATDLTLAAKSGWLSIGGESGREPLLVGGHVGQLAGGWAAASGAVLGFWQRARTGRGALVDLALLEVFVWLQWMATQRAAYEGITIERSGGRGGGHPWGVYPCRDGYVILIVGAGGRNWNAFADLMGMPALRDERFGTPRSRAEHADEIDALMLAWLMEHDAYEIYDRAQAAGLPFGTVATVADLLGDAQLAARDFFVPDADGLLMPSLPFKINGLRPQQPATATQRAV